MAFLMGLDVGGTFTDAVLLKEREVVASAKVPTDQDDVLNSILEALDQVVREEKKNLIMGQAGREGCGGPELQRIVLSTTVVTNAIAQGTYEPVGLVLIPGPGMDPGIFSWPVQPIVLKGGINYRGREITPLDQGEVLELAQLLYERGCQKVAVVGKFSQRNPIQEELVAGLLAGRLPDAEIECGHRVAGRLNFPRRAVTTYFTLAISQTYRQFAGQVKKVLAARQLEARVASLKADGGTIPLEYSLHYPLEMVFSGPAASTLGALALLPRDASAVVLDVGGTTSDLSLILGGKPLLASRGAVLNGYATQVRGFAVRSVPLGGDSVVHLEAGGQVVIGPQRVGPAFCLGGAVATTTDALVCLGLANIGNRHRAMEAMTALAFQLDKSPVELAQAVVHAVNTTLQGEIMSMVRRWQEEPAYKVWEVLQGRKEPPGLLVGLGGAAGGIVPGLAAAMGWQYFIPAQAGVANALGAAIARPTLAISLRADTQLGYWEVAEDGSRGEIPEKRRDFALEDALALAHDLLQRRARRAGLSDGEIGLVEDLYHESFNVVRGWETVGRLLEVGVGLEPGVLWHL